jgi:NADPH2:quinone reductase
LRHATNVEIDPMTAMKALVARTVGEPTEVLRLETRPVPEPGRGQVRVRVHAAPVHPTDLHIARGRYGFSPEFPAVLGVESVGTVDALGDGIESPGIGQRVITVGITGTWHWWCNSGATTASRRSTSYAAARRSTSSWSLAAPR